MINLKIKLTIFLLLAVLILPTVTFGATLDEQLAAKKKQIDDLENQIQAYQNEIKQKDSEAKTFQGQVNILNDKIKKLQTEINGLKLTIELTGLEIQSKEEKIAAKLGELDQSRSILSYNIQLLNMKDADSPLVSFIKSDSISDYLGDLNNLLVIQDNITASLKKILENKKALEEERSDLEEKQLEQEKLKALQEIQRHDALVKKTEKNNLLTQVKKRKSELATLLNLTEGQVEQLKNEIYYLQRNGITLEDALKYGQLVADRAGIRAGFLLALLEIESGLGVNVGKGRYKTDMNPNQWDYFLKITTKLGLDPDITPVSKKPNYGWGGAMGAAQFLPGTWLGYESKVATLTGHNPPSPWRVEDAFMAAAIKLSNDGASSKTRTGELAAAKKYLSGNPNCTKSICNWYANKVLEKSAEIEKNLTPNG